MSFLTFPTQAAAIAADKKIAKNLGCAKNAGDVTTQWYGPRLASDGKYFFEKPALPAAALNGVTGHTEVATQPAVDPDPLP